ncbi:hypothetical protein INT43_005158 [Umbelopsis isabellina]|uniref:Uncharacterized protein n=1 Tax=Mortierella isabellina TaxID=91625 RepID=A0A8H7UBF0_MORIS|nr:hypothetical protein INT43_005158 [Umbelopsis isabellina]
MKLQKLWPSAEGRIHRSLQTCLSIGYPSKGTGANTSISIHENGKAHKEMVEKFLRDVYKRGKQANKDKEEVQKELQRIEQAAISSYNSRDAGAGPKMKLPPSAPSNKPSTLSKPATKPKSKPAPAPPPKQPTEPFEMPVPREMAAEAGPGEWTVVSKPVVREEKKDRSEKASTTHDLRPEMQDEFAADEEDLRHFKIQEKSFPEDSFVEAGTNNDEGGVVFKKRKLGGQGKARNIRKK